MSVEFASLGASIAAHGLASSLPGFPNQPLGTDAWSALTEQVRAGRVPGLLAQAIADGALVVTPAQAREVAALHASALGLVVLLEGFLIEVVTTLVDHEIDYRVLKGPATARLDYPNARLRTFGDIDVLIPGEDFDRAVAAFARGGFERRLPELRPGFDRRFAKGAQLARARGFELDVHRTFADGPFGLASHPEDLFTGAARFEVAGRELRALCREDRFLHACFHVALSGDLRLSSLRDVAQLLLVSNVDGEFVRERARSWRAEPVLARGITRTWEMLGIIECASLSVWAAGYEYDRRARRALAASVGAGAGWPLKALEGLRAISGLRAKAAYAWAAIWPSERFMEARGLGRLARWRGVFTHVRPWLRLGHGHGRGPGISPRSRR